MTRDTRDTSRGGVAKCPATKNRTPPPTCINEMNERTFLVVSRQAPRDVSRVPRSSPRSAHVTTPIGAHR